MSKPNYLALLLLAVTGIVPVAAAPIGVVWRLPLQGPVSWDYLTFDQAHRRLFVSRGVRVDIIDVDHKTKVGQIDGTAGAHGITLAPALHRGYVSDGLINAVTVFDLNTFKVIATITGLGEKPDAIVYDSASKHVLTFNGKGHSFSVIDPARNVLIQTVPLPGKPEFAQADGNGHVYANLEDRSSLVEIDSRADRVLHVWPLPGCDSPSGLALDRTRHRLFSVCDNEHMAVTNALDGSHVATVDIGKGPDAVVYDPSRQMVYSSNGQSGNITAIRQHDADHYEVSASIPSQLSARTLALDSQHQQLYLSAATIDANKHGEGRSFLPDSFTLIAVGIAARP
ncbi:YncE family protein [Dyella jejuensis]|uniref:YncE family protein n=1 Tax=Dyella jejuensis TaxID=1432009 RepID=A0ABW8JJY3_9GAMM